MLREVVRVEGAGKVGLVVDVVMPATPSRLGFLLVHGLASNAQLWSGVGRFLEESGHPSAAVDLRGHGRSDKPDTGYDYDTFCADLEAVMRAFAGLAGVSRIVAVGQSFGANLVLELAARRPPALAGIACVDGGTIDLGEGFDTFEAVERELAPPDLAGTPAKALEARLREMHADWPEDAIAATMANFEVRPDGTVAPWLTRARHLTILRTMWDARPGDAYPKVDVPVLLMPAETPGAPDRWRRGKKAGVEAAEAALRDVRVKWFSPADHDVHAQQPKAVAEALVGRFGRHG